MMLIFLSEKAADVAWGNSALLSASDRGITIHLPTHEKHTAIQRAARRLAHDNIQTVQLAGEHWNLEYCWMFWQGFRCSKVKQKVIWPKLAKNEQIELENRLIVVNWVRQTINLPADTLGPEQLAQAAIDIVQQFALGDFTYKIIKGNQLKDQGYLGIYTVGKGSPREPLLLCIDYNPQLTETAPVMACIVGKGVTFDSGGYSLKSSEMMENMKADMGGAALATGSLALAVARGLKERVKLYLCCADNLIGGNAYKLGDIIRYRNGKTVEVLNSDAEGRLLLADGLIDAAAQNSPIIIDCATLTGAAKAAVGHDYHALFSFDNLLVDRLLTIAKKDKEPFWRLPLTQVHRNQLSSNFAELSNVSVNKYHAGASVAAGFLSHFIQNYQNGWIHIDCAASYYKTEVALWSSGATGLGVLTLASLLLDIANQ